MKKLYGKGMETFLTEEEGIGVVEVILILVVLIGLVIIFKKELTALINDIFKKDYRTGRKNLIVKRMGAFLFLLALTLTIILAFLFSTLEAARVNGLKSLAIRRQTMEMQSLFGAYNQELWEHYGLLFLDMSYGSGEPDVRLMEGHMMENDYARGEEAHF